MNKHSLDMLVGLKKPYAPPPSEFRRKVSSLVPEDDEDVQIARNEEYQARKAKLLRFLRTRGKAASSELRPVLGMSWGNLTKFLDEMAILGLVRSEEVRSRGTKTVYWKAL